MILNQKPKHQIHPDDLKQSSNGGFFRKANTFSIHQSTFNEIQGDMVTVYSHEQPSLVCIKQSIQLHHTCWPKYSGTAIDGPTLTSEHCDICALVPSSQAFVPWRWSRHNGRASKCTASINTLMMKIAFTITSHLSNHRACSFLALLFLGYSRRAQRLARRPDVSQFFGTSIANSDHDRFIVLSGGKMRLNDLVKMIRTSQCILVGGLSFTNVFAGTLKDLRLIATQHVSDDNRVPSFHDCSWLSSLSSFSWW